MLSARRSAAYERTKSFLFKGLLVFGCVMNLWVLVLVAFNGSKAPERMVCSYARTQKLLTGYTPWDTCDGRGSNSSPLLAVTPQWLAGTWLSARKGGEDGKTPCTEYAAPAIFRRNGDLAQVMKLAADGAYRSAMRYKTPSGAIHQTDYHGRWSLEGDQLTQSEVEARDAFRTTSASSTLTAARLGDNVLTLDNTGGSQRWVRCTL
ncbi:hypothetical protein [Sphingomonas immobilis]|uniref:Uncharacterized protein n=1 Tax=Sphingomonas immobilis TaxID=3063997 RepID=A0ABT9A2J3_9SPHN|nr:hypothetical protein [Sphingomonas sp. CA1-15]MDO7843768.1 hypothetical protein [Sphingomonas sp. CA1-15]